MICDFAAAAEIGFGSFPNTMIDCHAHITASDFDQVSGFRVVGENKGKKKKERERISLLTPCKEE